MVRTMPCTEEIRNPQLPGISLCNALDSMELVVAQAFNREDFYPSRAWPPASPALITKIQQQAYPIRS